MPSISFTETFTSLSVTVPTSGWVTIDLAASGVPANAVVSMLITYGGTANSCWVGTRAVGSSLNRYFRLAEAEAGGVTSISMHVKSDASSDIQVYAERSSVTFYILGYYGSDVDYTELMGVDAWTEVSGFLAQPSGGKAGRVNEMLCINQSQTDAWNAGIRQYDSSLNRIVSLHEAESDDSAGNTFLTMMVNVAGDGRVGLSCSGAMIIFRAIGYFSANVQFLEDFTSLSITSASTWIVQNATANYNGAVAMIACMHYDRNNEVNVGAKTNNSGTRYILEHEAESNGNTGCTFPVLVNSSTQYYIYCGNASAEYFYCLGYLYTDPYIQEVIGSSWKGVNDLQVIVGGAWKHVSQVKVVIGGVWKRVLGIDGFN